MLLAHTKTRVEKGFWNAVGQSPGNMRLADAKLVDKVIGCEFGWVNVFSLVNDHGNKCSLIIDKTLENEEYMAFHPMCGTALIELKTTDFHKFLKSIGKEAKYYDVTKVAVKPKKEKK